MSTVLSFRPTRRDLLLCLLTLSISYIFLLPSRRLSYDPDQYEYDAVTNTVGRIESASGAGAGSGPSASGRTGGVANKYLPEWLWPSTASRCPGQSGEAREQTFAESVRTYGTSAQSSTGSGAAEWDQDQGNEEFGTADAPLRGHTPAGPGSALGVIQGTDLLGHQAGWTLMDRVYIFNGSLYVVTSNRTAWPDLIRMTSTGLPADNQPGNAELRKPKGNEFVFITQAEAAELWGPRVQRMSGVTWMFNDGQFLDHYYHFSAELLLGSWRAYASLDPNISPRGETSLVPPRRAWFRHSETLEWRDKPRFNPLVLFAAFPSISLLYSEDWDDLARITNSSNAPTHARAVMLERCLFADRSAAFYGPYTAPTSRTAAGALWVGQTSQWWWEPIRRQILRYSGLDQATLDRNLEGVGAIDPVHFDPTATQPWHRQHTHPIGRNPLRVTSEQQQQQLAANPQGKPAGDYKPVVTYISRQSSRRRLGKDSHEDLVRALEAKRDEMGFELHIVEAERLSREEQLALAGRTTIMLGVHGNGLTHLLWMPATPRSAVIEMFYRGGFARDYQWTAHALGMRHFGVNHDVYHTAPNLPEVDYPEGFHGTEITVDGTFVADLIEKRLKGEV